MHNSQKEQRDFFHHAQLTERTKRFFPTRTIHTKYWGYFSNMHNSQKVQERFFPTCTTHRKYRGYFFSTCTTHKKNRGYFFQNAQLTERTGDIFSNTHNSQKERQIFPTCTTHKKSGRSFFKHGQLTERTKEFFSKMHNSQKENDKRDFPPNRVILDFYLPTSALPSQYVLFVQFKLHFLLSVMEEKTVSGARTHARTHTHTHARRVIIALVDYDCGEQTKIM